MGGGEREDDHASPPSMVPAWASPDPEEGGLTMANARRLDLFSRKTRPGWTAFGDEAGKFDAAIRNLDLGE